MVLSVSAGWDADARDPAGLRAARGRHAPWAPVGAPIEASLGRTGLAWGRGLHPAGLPGPEKREGDGKSPAGRLRPAPRHGLREGAARRAPGCRTGRRPRRCAASTTRARASTTSSPTRRRRRRTGPRPRTCGAKDDLYRLVVWVGHNDAPVVPGGGSCIFLHLRSGPDATTAGCTAFEPEPMERLLRWLDPAARPVLVQLPEAEHRARAAEWGLPEPRPRARDLGLAPGVFPPGPLNADHRRGRRARRPGDARRGRHGPHRRHRRPAARGEPLPGEGAGGRLRRQRVREARGIHPGARARDDRDADRPHEHARGRDGGRGGGRVDARAARQRGRALGERARGRDERRRRSTTSARCPVRREHVVAAIRSADGGPGRRRARSAPGRAPRPSAGRAASAPRRGGCPSASAATRWASSCRRTSAAS